VTLDRMFGWLFGKPQRPGQGQRVDGDRVRAPVRPAQGQREDDARPGRGAGTLTEAYDQAQGFRIDYESESARKRPRDAYTPDRGRANIEQERYTPPPTHTDAQHVAGAATPPGGWGVAAPNPPLTPAPPGGLTRRLSIERGTAPQSVVAVLIGITGKLAGEVYKIRDSENRLGRSESADICLGDRDDTISRKHALVIHKDGAFLLKRDQAQNPMTVNDETVTETGVMLTDGDSILIGETTFCFRVAFPAARANS